MNETERHLWRWATRFGDYFKSNSHTELLQVMDALQDPRPLPNRKRALIFSVYQLLINGAVAEHNISEYRLNIPEHFRQQINDDLLEQAAYQAWQGTAYKPNRPNVLGSIAFTVVLLFFFESACKIALGTSGGLRSLVERLKADSRIDSETCQALRYMIGLRNVWHNFGLHASDECIPYRPKDTSLSFPDLLPHQIIQPVGEREALHLVDKVLDTFCDLFGIP